MQGNGVNLPGVTKIRVLEQFKRNMKTVLDKGRLWTALPIWASLAIFIGIGPLWQQTLSSSLDAPAPSIYAAAFEEGLVHAPSLGEWLGIGFDPGIALASLIACILAVTSRSYWAAAIRATIGAVIAISVADTSILIYNGNPNGILENLVFNALGSPLIWMFLIVLFYARDRINFGTGSTGSKKVVFCASALGSAALISTACWLIFQTLYNPAKVQFVLAASPPIEGYFMNRKTVADVGGQKNTRYFSILPHNSLVRKVKVDGFSRAGGGFGVQWRQIDMSTAFEIRIWANYDCIYPKALANLPVGEPSLVFEAKSLKVGMTKGSSHFLAETSATRVANLDVPLLAQYWIKNDSKGKSYSITAFVGFEDSFSINPDTSYRFYFGGPLMKVDGETSRSAKRELRFEIDGKPFYIRAGGSRPRLASQMLSCHAIKNAKLIKSLGRTEIVVPNADTYFAVGAVFEIRQKPVPLEIFRSVQSKLVVKETNGWVEFSGLDFERTLDKGLGAGRGISISRNVTRLIINGNKIETSPEDDLFILGDVRPSLDENRLSVSGTAYGLWLNNRRMNPTIWEGLGGWQIPCLTAIIGLLGLLVRWLMPSIVDFIRGRSLEPLVIE